MRGNSSETYEDLPHLFELDLAEDENIYIYNLDVNCSIELDNVEILSIEKSSRVDGYGDCGEFGERAFIRLGGEVDRFKSLRLNRF